MQLLSFCRRGSPLSTARGAKDIDQWRFQLMMGLGPLSCQRVAQWVGTLNSGRVQF